MAESFSSLGKHTDKTNETNFIGFVGPFWIGCEIFRLLHRQWSQPISRSSPLATETTQLSMQETLAQQFQQTSKKLTISGVSKQYGLLIRAANNLLKEMDAQGLFAKQAQSDREMPDVKQSPADEGTFTLGEAQPVKGEQFTLGEEEKQLLSKSEKVL